MNSAAIALFGNVFDADFEFKILAKHAETKEVNVSEKLIGVIMEEWFPGGQATLAKIVCPGVNKLLVMSDVEFGKLRDRPGNDEIHCQGIDLRKLFFRHCDEVGQHDVLVIAGQVDIGGNDYRTR